MTKYSFLRLQITFILCLLGSSFLTAQNFDEKDSVIISAMKDELENNMSKLQEDGYDKPFFMGYRVSDISIRLASATFGSLLTSKGGKNRDWNTRVMVGDYALNDEHFNDAFEGSSNDVYFENVPIDNDYWGLRRLLWAGTNNVYKRAARLYKQKQKAIKGYDVKYKLNDFSEVPVNNYLDNNHYDLASKEQLERMSVELSGYLMQFDSLRNANAIVTDIGSRNYYYNSEGTSVIKDDQITVVLVNVSRLDKDNRYHSAGVDYFASDITGLPSLSAIKKDLDWYIEYLKRKPTIEKLDEEYNGPLLLKGQAVAEFFKANLFNTKKGILPTRGSFSNKDEQTVSRFFENLDESLTDEDKVKIGNKQMIVTAHSSMKSFDGIPLIGSYDIDGDGVVPVDNLVLIKGGKVLKKINGRIPAPYADASTGSNRFSMSIGGVGNIIAPGVLKVDFVSKVSLEELMKDFDERITENDMDKGIVLDMPKLTSISKPKQYFFYNKDNGQMEQVAKASFSYGKKNNLKKIVAVSDEYFVYNFLYSGSLYGSNSSGVPVSMIVPAAILLKDMDVSKVTYKGKKLDAIVPKPALGEK